MNTSIIRTISFLLIMAVTPGILQSQPPPQEFEFEISTMAAYYYFAEGTINGEPLDTGDWIGAFCNDVCSGAGEWLGPYSVVPIMGDDGSDYTEGYCDMWDVIEFRIFDQSEFEYYNAQVSEDIPWENFALPIIDWIMVESDVDCYGTPGGDAFIDDCGECVGGLTGMLPNWAMDDCGICFGGNDEMDCNGDCFGFAYYDACGICSEGNSGHPANSDMDCAGVCFGDSEWDDLGECCLFSEIDDCGICFGENADMDCSGECFGFHIYDILENCCLEIEFDDCGICNGENADLDDCGICFGENADMDYCGVCFGENDCPGNGDVTADGSVDVLDAVRLIAIITSAVIPSEYELWAADLINDGSIDVLDAVNLISIITSGSGNSR